MRKMLWLMTTLFLFVSCASTTFSGTAACTGRVCGPNGEGIAQYQLTIDGKSVVTGLDGVFVIPALKSGSYRLVGKGRGWTAIERDIDFVDRRGIVYVQVEPMSAVYGRVEAYLRAALYDEAEAALCAQAEANAGDALFDFYCALVVYCQSPSSEKAESIKKSIAKEAEYAL